MLISTLIYNSIFMNPLLQNLSPSKQPPATFFKRTVFGFTLTHCYLVHRRDPLCHFRCISEGHRIFLLDSNMFLLSNGQPLQKKNLDMQRFLTKGPFKQLITTPVGWFAKKLLQKEPPEEPSGIPAGQCPSCSTIPMNHIKKGCHAIFPNLGFLLQMAQTPKMRKLMAKLLLYIIEEQTVLKSKKAFWKREIHRKPWKNQEIQ